MPGKAQDDDVVMNLVDLALARPPDERQAYLRSACSGDTDLLTQVQNYVEWEQRMNGFLLDPLYPPASFDHPFQPGELLEERFRIVREVAQGGMGIVYEAQDEKLERRIALKCAKLGFRKRLPPEVRHATEVSHPNVCKIFEIHTASTPQGEIDFLTMEFLEGETLAERLQHEPLPQKDARSIALQLCAGLAAAHRNQVIHGDLKSSNVILTSTADGAIRAVITDFGLAQRPATAHAAAPSLERAGTPDYMAPELWKGEPASVASDIYALGVILYELAAGRRPRRPENWEERLAWKPPAVHPKWDRILSRCLDPDPARRFQTAEQVGQALAPPLSRRWMLAAAAAMVLALATGVVTYQRATAPAVSVRLAMLPLESDRDSAAMADRLFHDAAAQLARLKGNTRTKLTVVPPDNTLLRHVDTVEKARAMFRATHVLHGTLSQENGHVMLHAYLTDAGSLTNARDWKAEYAPGELRYAPVALAGMVSGTLRLPPLAMAAAVNAAARQDYQAGIAAARRETGVDEALTLLERAVTADPDSPLTYAALSEAQWLKYVLVQDRAWLDRATESERQAELRDPDSASVHRAAGILYANAGRYELAEAEYRRAIEIEPNNSDAYRRLGLVLEQNNQLDAALAAYRQALQAEPNYYSNHQALGSFYVGRANYGEAAKYFSKTVELAPGEPSAHYVLGVTYLDLGRFAEAENEFLVSIRLGETPTALNALGDALMYESRDREAVQYISQALGHSQEHYLWWMNLGTAYRRIHLQAESDRANRRGLALAEKEMAKNPRDGGIRAHLAYLCARLGDRQRAQSEIAQALQLSPDDADTRFAAATTYEALGQRDGTLALLSASPAGVIADISRWPDVADLRSDPRFLQLLASHQLK
jgi:eukaryotic-like serine/threonine-protein kinase